MQFIKILDFEYIGEVITPDKNTDVPSKHKDLYNITVSTDGDITKHKVIIEDRWFDYPPSTIEQFDKVIRKEFGNWVVNDFTAWYMYLDAFKKAHPEVTEEMEKITNEPTDQEIHLFGTDLIVHKTTVNSYTNFHCRECYFNFMGRCQAILNGKHLCSCKDGCDQWFELKKDGTQQ